MITTISFVNIIFSYTYKIKEKEKSKKKKKLGNVVFHIDRCQATDLANFVIYFTVYKIF